MNSVRQKATAKVWTVDDFMPGKTDTAQPVQCSTDDEIYAQLMKYMPAAVQ
jgi:hypothetical protein